MLLRKHSARTHAGTTAALAVLLLCLFVLRGAFDWVRPLHNSQFVVEKAARPECQTSKSTTNWAVFSSSSAVLTPGIRQLAAFDDWQVLVVAEHPHTPALCAPNITFLTWQQQQQLGYSILKFLPKHGSW